MRSHLQRTHLCKYINYKLMRGEILWLNIFWLVLVQEWVLTPLVH
nr:MAG TPA: hypothetical protein [Caudoviricetes sp.]